MAVQPVVIPSSWQTDRTDLDSALVAIIEAFIASVSGTVVRKMWSEIPKGITGEHPFVYVGQIVEEIAHDASTRATIYRGTLGYVDILTNPQETNARVSIFADYMRDLFTANSAVVGLGVLEQTGFDDSGEIKQGNVVMTDCKLSFKWSVLEGRN